MCLVALPPVVWFVLVKEVKDVLGTIEWAATFPLTDIKLVHEVIHATLDHVGVLSLASGLSKPPSSRCIGLG